MVCKMQPGSESLGIIARELALDIADSVYSPQLVTHVPGVANLAADALSRMYQPDKRYKLPPILKDAVRIDPEPRTAAWWRAAVPRLRHGGSTSGPAALEWDTPDDQFQ